jgi:hypothetical protein
MGRRPDRSEAKTEMDLEATIRRICVDRLSNRDIYLCRETDLVRRLENGSVEPYSLFRAEGARRL